MHVLYIHQYFATPHGSTGTRSYEFARRWVSAGHRVTMLTTTAQLTDRDLAEARGRRVRRFAVDGIEVVALDIPYRQQMGTIARLWAFGRFMASASWRTLTARGVDAVYASSTPLTVAVPALCAWWLRRRPYLFEVRDLWPAVPVGLGVLRNRVLIGLARLLERGAYRGARAVVTLSPSATDIVRRDTPHEKPVIEVPNAADTENFSPEVDGSDMRRRMEWGSAIVFVHPGAMGRVNGLDAVVRAAIRFRDDPRLLFALVGEGREKPRLIEMAAREGLTNLRIHAGVPKHEMPALLAAADVGLMTVMPAPVLEHNSANKFFDYLAAGRPVVLNYGGWMREAVEEAEAGIGCTMGDEEAFFQAIARLARDDALRRSMGQAARRLALGRFNRDDLAARALDVVTAAARIAT